jgi:hypothetical protein
MTPDTMVPLQVRTVLLERMQENVVGGPEPADVSKVIAQAAQVLVAARTDPAKVHAVQRLLRFVARAGWNLAKLLTDAGMAVINYFLDQFAGFVGYVCAIVVLGAAVALGFVTAGPLSALLGSTWGNLMATVFGALMTAFGFKKSAYWFAKHREASLYYKALGTSFLGRPFTDLKNLYFKLWNGYTLLEWEAFKKRYAYLGLSDGELGALLRIQATKTPEEFSKYVDMLDKQYHDHRRRPGDPIPDAQNRTNRWFFQRWLSAASDAGAARAPPPLVRTARRAHGQGLPHDGRDQAAHDLLDALERFM